MSTDSAKTRYGHIDKKSREEAKAFCLSLGPPPLLERKEAAVLAAEWIRKHVHDGWTPRNFAKFYRVCHCKVKTKPKIKPCEDDVEPVADYDPFEAARAAQPVQPPEVAVKIEK